MHSGWASPAATEGSSAGSRPTTQSMLSSTAESSSRTSAPSGGLGPGCGAGPRRPLETPQTTQERAFGSPKWPFLQYTPSTIGAPAAASGSSTGVASPDESGDSSAGPVASRTGTAAPGCSASSAGPKSGTWDFSVGG